MTTNGPSERLEAKFGECKLFLLISLVTFKTACLLLYSNFFFSFLNIYFQTYIFVILQNKILKSVLFVTNSSWQMLSTVF